MIIAYEILHFQTILYCNSSCSGEAKSKISFHFFAAPPFTPPRRKSRIKEEKFLVFAPATEGSGRGAQISRHQDSAQNAFGFHRTEGAS